MLLKGVCASSALCASKYCSTKKHQTSSYSPIVIISFYSLVFSSYTSAPSLTPDDDVFKHLSLTYSNNHAKMNKGVNCRTSQTSFPRVNMMILFDILCFTSVIICISLFQGITNGAEWYPLIGGMQDYNYVWYGCMEITLEVSCCKYPPAHELPRYWEDNKVVGINRHFRNCSIQISDL